MSRTIAVFAALVLASAVVVASGTPASDDEDARQLYGYFGPGLTIHVLKDGVGGDPVTSLRPGDYTLTVHDTSAFHNFHIFGPGLDQIVTTVPFIGDVTVEIHLSHGAYTYQCDPHAALGMTNGFVVGGVGQVGD
jgi:plastocyanin